MRLPEEPSSDRSLTATPKPPLSLPRSYQDRSVIDFICLGFYPANYRLADRADDAGSDSPTADVCPMDGADRGRSLPGESQRQVGLYFRLVIGTVSRGG